MSVEGYAGDITPLEAWTVLNDQPNSILVDVRTEAEWAFVGFPDLSGLGKSVCFVEWLSFPGMEPNPDFVAAVKKVQSDRQGPVLLLCRSGQRSISSARALTEAGFSRCFNVLEGFEGDKDTDGHRGSMGGWKVSGLPWQQK